jgi:hypothetical protein
MSEQWVVCRNKSTKQCHPSKGSSCRPGYQLKKDGFKSKKEADDWIESNCDKDLLTCD